ncbi:uncharacterized protein YoxC [Dysgonomonas sp. PFB1-18]|uniref:DUF6549 family protein n=1 Tax=unclassified Dysgonomonas TaxID=2630389 RepID=UPI0024731CC5|nr:MULTISPECIES: DUF6549 family protein [unclassified Dysgonomonas]MDH6308056.1 uncharacterized protein YoxC [Dysgonomonas sp. PF1-14]MDH6339595.1 uncharacterized protein YoxC [Dysgonomonas sp. PF1-16]MDH6381246.1 uncharacterized protein YoxC [Dysgonomonas sp. PFB1-18]MDH6398458.1 uncharacterized protein YoxC [Dysgonomonas sp. PF1-23]
MNKYLISAIAVLFLAVGLLSWQLDRTKTEKKRLSSNQEALLSDIEFYKTEAGDNAASVQRLELSKSELEKHCEDLTQTVKDLNLKVKRIQAASTTVTKTEYKIQTVVKDSIIYRDVPVIVQSIVYKDPWIDIDGVIDSSMFSGNISTRDTLVQVIHRVPKKFWFIKYGTKAIKQEVVSKNPHSNIVFTEYIELKK